MAMTSPLKSLMWGGNRKFMLRPRMKQVNQGSGAASCQLWWFRRPNVPPIQKGTPIPLGAFSEVLRRAEQAHHQRAEVAVHHDAQLRPCGELYDHRSIWGFSQPVKLAGFLCAM